MKSAVVKNCIFLLNRSDNSYIIPGHVLVTRAIKHAHFLSHKLFNKRSFVQKSGILSASCHPVACWATSEWQELLITRDSHAFDVIFLDTVL